MKNTNKISRFLGFLGLFLGINLAQAQSCIRNISTNPLQPKNDVFNSWSGTRNPLLNSFDISRIVANSFFDIPLNVNSNWSRPNNTASFIYIANPYSYSTFSADYSYLHYNGLKSPYLADAFWQDGWELMWMNTGFFPNGDRMDLPDPSRKMNAGISSLTHPAVPYLIYYNRYTGRMRLFANVFAPIGTFDNFRVEFVYNDKNLMSGIFRNTDVFDQALDLSSILDGVSTFNQNPNNDNVFWSSDIQLAYDPCICQYPTNFNFKIHGFDTLHVNLLQRSITHTMPLQDASGKPIYKDFLYNVDLRREIGTGSVIYKSLDKLLDNYQKELETYNHKKAEFNKPMNTMARELVKAAKASIVLAGSGLIPQDDLGSLALRQLVKINGPESRDSVLSKDIAKTVVEGTKGLLGIAYDQLFTTALGEDFFKAPVRPNMPTAMFQEGKIQGSITNITSIDVAAGFYTPGSFKLNSQADARKIPAYDEAVGLYALLKTPSLRVHKDGNRYSEDRIIRNTPTPPYTGGWIEIDTLVHKTMAHEVSFRLDKELLYKLNRVLDFDDSKTKLYVSFEVDYENTDDQNFPDYHPAQNIVCVAGKTTDLFLFSAPSKSNQEGDILKFSSRWFDIQDVSNKTFELAFEEFIHYASAKVWIHPNIYNLRTTPTYSNDTIPYGPSRLKLKCIKMKIAADMYFLREGSNGIPINSYMVNAFQLYDSEKEVDRITTHGIWVTEKAHVKGAREGALRLKNEQIDRTDSFVIEVAGNELIIAYDNILVEGTISVEPGYKARLFAKENVEISPSSLISPNILIEEGEHYKTIGQSREATSAEITSFCSNRISGYKAGSLAKNDPMPIDDTSNEASALETNEDSYIFPVPTENTLFFKSGNLHEETYSFRIFDLQGRLILQEKNAGNQQPVFAFDLMPLSPGFYLLEALQEKTGKKESFKFIVNK